METRDKDVIIGTIIMGIIILSAIAVVVLLLISDDPFGQMAKSITLERQNIYEEIIIGKEKEVKLTATTKNITDNLVWSSSDEKIATVEKLDETKAKVTLVGEGSATITVSDGNIKTACNIKVTYPEPSIIIKQNNKNVTNQTIYKEVKKVL